MGSSRWGQADVNLHRLTAEAAGADGAGRSRQDEPLCRGASSQLKPALETRALMERFRALNLGSLSTTTQQLAPPYRSVGVQVDI